jgi:hypothetical protein
MTPADLERADRPSRELEADIAEIFGTGWDVNACEELVFNPPAYTSSIDAALTLVPEGYCVSAMGEVPDDCCWYVVLWRDGSEKPEFEVRADSLPLALCAAALRAKEADDAD